MTHLWTPRAIGTVARWLILAGLVVLGSWLAPPAAGQPPAARQLIRIDAPTPEERTALVRMGLDVAGADLAGLTVWADEEQLRAVRRAGFRYAVLPQPSAADLTVDPTYHYYEGAVAETQRLAAQYPTLARLLTIGTTIEGRPIPALKISRRPELDESKPAALIFALTHGREHLSTEMALYTMRFLLEGYGTDAGLTNLVNQREIYVVPVLNPDGDVYDITGGSYQSWRKNRRPNPDGSFGVDLNRNFAYRWGCCGGSSDIMAQENYRGPAPFSEDETQALRDFVTAHPNIRVSLSLHTFSELVLWPYGYTRERVPADMRPDDQAAFAALGRAMAGLNGYHAMQSSDLYITDGNSDDWLYGERGIFAFTFEMYPPGSPPGFYPPGGVIERETRRNQPAIEYLLAMADAPRKVLGREGDTTPPAVRLIAPAAGLVVHGPLHLAAVAQDNAGVTLVEFLVNGQSMCLDDAPPYECVWQGPLPLTDLVLSARAYDAGQNIGASPAINVRYSPQPPAYFPLFAKR